MTAPDDSAAPATPRPRATRSFGRFELRELLGRSERTMAWLAEDDPAGDHPGQALVLVMPREQPADAEAAAQWEQRARKAVRLNHPNLAPALELGLIDRWPYVAYAAAGATALTAQIGADGLPARDAADTTAQIGRGLAFAHEAGMVHGDVQPYLVRVGDNGNVRLMGLEVALDTSAELALPTGSAAAPAADAGEAERRRQQRAAARRDVLTLALVLHLALTGQAALDEADTGLVVRRL
ncbi:MAG TPA: protein kinase, partial [Rubrivivax sp.]